MAFGVDGMPAGRVIVKTALLTLGSLGFAFCLTLVFESMRSVMDVGGSCASGGPYEVRQPCPEGVAWVMPVAIFGGLLSVGLGAVGVFAKGGPRPFAFAWSALFLALGYNFFDYGFDPPGGGTSVSWIVCGAIFFAMGGLPLFGLLSRSARRWALWGPARDEPRGPTRPIKFVSAPVTRLSSYARPGTPAGPSVPTPTAPTAPTAPTPTIEASGSSEDVVTRLERLAALHDRGALDDEEYQVAKQAILTDGVDS